MEQRITKEFPQKLLWVGGKRIGHQNSVQLIRYADDFVVLHEDLSIVLKCQEIISEWLRPMGLELKPSKTKLTHTLYQHEDNVGFNFLGFHVRQFPVGKCQSGRNGSGKLLGFKTLIKPSKESIHEHLRRLKLITKSHKTSSQLKFIEKLNPVIRGWSNYFSAVVSKSTYSKLDNWQYHQLRSWSKRRHPRQSQHWISNKYWLIDRGGGWRFAASIDDSVKKIAKHSETPIVRHVKVQGNRSPYDGDWVYWSVRMGKHPEVGKRVSTLLKRQKGKCSECQLFFKEGDRLEVDHIIPRSQGGKDANNNFKLIHRHCHDLKTARDFSL